jgi:predicted DNA-binding transcriptional regulator AlpA
MTKPKSDDTQPATLTLAAACRRFGIATYTTKKLMLKGEFPKAFQLGGKRLLPRRKFENWMAQKLGDET